MSLASVLDIPPGPTGFQEWSWAHWKDHQEIVQGLLSVKNVRAPIYVIDPVPLGDTQGWLLRHQEFHDDMNATLKLQGVDLQTVNFKNPRDRSIWIYQNFREHLAARQALGI